MKDYIILLLVFIILLLSTFLLKNQISAQVIKETNLETCIYQSRTGVNILPDKDICCQRISQFLKCENKVNDIKIGAIRYLLGRECYNKKDGELRAFFNKNLKDYCIGQGYLIR